LTHETICLLYRNRNIYLNNHYMTFSKSFTPDRQMIDPLMKPKVMKIIQFGRWKKFWISVCISKYIHTTFTVDYANALFCECEQTGATSGQAMNLGELHQGL